MGAAWNKFDVNGDGDVVSIIFKICKILYDKRETHISDLSIVDWFN